MKFSNAIKLMAACAIATSAMPAFSHIVLENKSALAGSSYKAVFRVGHGCKGAAITGVSVQIPSGFQGAKPYPKAGWTLAVQRGKLPTPYDDHGKSVNEDVTLVTWTAASKEAALQETYVDEFMLRGKLVDTAGPMWFKVLQTCETGSNNWSDVPASGTETQGLSSPAVLLEVSAVPQAAPAHGQHKH